MDESEEEKMRRRREKAAAWAAGRADPIASDKPQMSNPGKESSALREDKEAAPRDWRGWAREVSSEGSGGSGAAAGGPGGAAGGPGGGGGWRNMVGGLQALADSFGSHNSAARKQVF